jgi:hypothetical protein
MELPVSVNASPDLDKVAPPRTLPAGLAGRPYGAAQAQFAASFRSPLPLYFAYCG